MLEDAARHPQPIPLGMQIDLQGAAAPGSNTVLIGVADKATIGKFDGRDKTSDKHRVGVVVQVVAQHPVLREFRIEHSEVVARGPNLLTVVVKIQAADAGASYVSPTADRQCAQQKLG